MDNGLHFSTLADKALYNFSSHSPVYTHAAMQGAGVAIGSNLVSHIKIFGHVDSQEETGIKNPQY